MPCTVHRMSAKFFKLKKQNSCVYDLHQKNPHSPVIFAVLVLPQRLYVTNDDAFSKIVAHLILKRISALITLKHFNANFTALWSLADSLSQRFEATSLHFVATLPITILLILVTPHLHPCIITSQGGGGLKVPHLGLGGRGVWAPIFRKNNLRCWILGMLPPCHFLYAASLQQTI